MWLSNGSRPHSHVRSTSPSIMICDDLVFFLFCLFVFPPPSTETSEEPLVDLSDVLNSDADILGMLGKSSSDSGALYISQTVTVLRILKDLVTWVHKIGWEIPSDNFAFTTWFFLNVTFFNNTFCSPFLFYFCLHCLKRVVLVWSSLYFHSLYLVLGPCRSWFLPLPGWQLSSFFW